MSATPSPHVAGSLPEQFGPYRILKRLGQGGMGTVYLALDTRLDRQVALKVCHLGDRPDAMERFRREAKAAASLRHPNLCPVHECDVIDGVPYFTMAYIEGPTLDEWVEKRGGLTQREAAILVRKLALALQAAHDKGVIHRDLKPSNIAMEKGEPVVLDFGLAKYAGASERRLTVSGVLIGTPTYMAPEQVEGITASIGVMTDVYSLGVILYELLTGRPPFEGPTTGILVAIVTRQPLSPRSLRSEIDEQLSNICMRCLAKRPDQRWAFMYDLANALADWSRNASETSRGPLAIRVNRVANHQWSSKPLSLDQTPVPPAPIDTLEVHSCSHAKDPLRRKTAIWSVGIALVLLFLLSLGSLVVFLSLGGLADGKSQRPAQKQEVQKLVRTDDKLRGPAGVVPPSSHKARSQRWSMTFDTKNGGDYVEQLSALDVYLAIPVPGTVPIEYKLIRNLKTRPPKLYDEDLANIKRMFWFDNDAKSVRSVVTELGLQFEIDHFVVFMTVEMEQKLLDLERRYRNRKEEDIDATVFRIRRVNGTRYEPYVTSQTQRR